MQMILGTIGIGIGIPKTKVEVGSLNILKFYLRNTKGSMVHKFQVTDLVDIGGKSGTFILSAVETEWFELNPTNSQWAFAPHKLIGTTVQVITSGIVGIRFGTVDFTFKKLNKYNEPETLVDQCRLKARGITFSNISIQGKVAPSVM